MTSSLLKRLADEPDLVLREAWQVKDAISEEFGHDLKKLFEHLKNVHEKEMERRRLTETQPSTSR